MKKVRYVVQGGFLFLMIFLAVKHQIYRGGPSGTPPIDSYCPFGGIETAYLYLTSGTFVHRVGESNFIMLLGLVLMGILLKSGFCGWICPFGTVQEWLGKLGKKLFGLNKDKSPVPERVDRVGRYMKYPLFVIIIIATIVSGRMIFREWDPFIAFFHMGFGELPWTAYMVLIVVLLGSLFIIRFWCRYFCPLAVIVGFIGKLGLYKIECDTEKCVDCQKCEKLCPMDLSISGQGRITTVECNSCLDCLESKDIKDAIHLRLPKGGMRLSPAFYPAILIVLFFGVIVTAQVTGNWRTGKGPGKHHHQIIRTQPETQIPESSVLNKDSLTGKRTVRNEPQTEHNEEERTIKVGEKDVAIMGYMTLAEIESLTSCSASHLISKLKLPSDVSKNTNIGKLKRIYGFDIQDVRKYIREYLKNQ